MGGNLDPVGAAVLLDEMARDRTATAELTRAERTGRGGGGGVRDLLSRLEALGLEDLAAEPRRWVARADVLADEIRQARAAAEREHVALIRRLASGDVQLAEVVAAGPAYRSVMPEGPGSAVVAGAVVDCRARADAALRTDGAKLWRALVRVADQVVSESVKLAKKLPAGVDSDAAAWRAGGAAVETWSRLGELVDRFVAVHETVEPLQLVCRTQIMQLGPESTLSPPSPGWMRYRAPHKLPKDYMARAPQLRLSVAVAVGAGPGLYDADDAVARYVRHNRTGIHAKLNRALGVS